MLWGNMCLVNLDKYGPYWSDRYATFRQSRTGDKRCLIKGEELKKTTKKYIVGALKAFNIYVQPCKNLTHSLGICVSKVVRGEKNALTQKQRKGGKSHSNDLFVSCAS